MYITVKQVVVLQQINKSKLSSKKLQFLYITFKVYRRLHQKNTRNLILSRIKRH